MTKAVGYFIFKKMFYLKTATTENVLKKRLRRDHGTSGVSKLVQTDKIFGRRGRTSPVVVFDVKLTAQIVKEQIESVSS